MRSTTQSAQRRASLAVYARRRLTKYQHGDLAVRQDLLCLAAKKERLHAPPSVGSHQDQVATFCLRRRDNRLVGLVTGLSHGLTGHIRRLGSLHNDREESICVGFAVLFEIYEILPPRFDHTLRAVNNHLKL